jgi:hypothetical protein
VIQPKKPTDLTPLASYLQSLATGDTAAIEARDGSKKHEKTELMRRSVQSQVAYAG